MGCLQVSVQVLPSFILLVTLLAFVYSQHMGSVNMSFQITLVGICFMTYETCIPHFEFSMSNLRI